MDRSEMIARVGSGLLSFPVTPFDSGMKFAEGRYRDRSAWLLEHDVAGLFVAGGAGDCL